MIVGLVQVCDNSELKNKFYAVDTACSWSDYDRYIMYLKQMSPMELIVFTRLIHIGHFEGMPLRKFSNDGLDFIVTRIIYDELYMQYTMEDKYSEMWNGRQAINDHNRSWFKKALRRWEQWQSVEHGKKVEVEKDQLVDDWIKRARKDTKIILTEFSEKLNRLKRNIEIQLMGILNLKKSMSESEYYLYTCTSSLKSG